MELKINDVAQKAIVLYAQKHNITLFSNNIRTSVSMLKPCPSGFSSDFFKSYNASGMQKDSSVVIVYKDENHITHCQFENILEKKLNRRPEDYIHRPRISIHSGGYIHEML